MTSWAGEGSGHIQGPVWVCWAGALAAGRCMHTGVRGRPVGLQARVQVQSPGWVLGGSQPETPSRAHGSDLTRSCGPTAPSSALHPTLSWSGRRLFLCPAPPPRPCSVLAAPQGLCPSCPHSGPSGCFCPLEASSFKERGSGSHVSLGGCSVRAPPRPGPGASGMKPASRPPLPRQTQGWSGKGVLPSGCSRAAPPTDLHGKAAL